MWQEMCIQCFGGRPDGKRDHLEDLGIDSTIVLNGSSRSGMGRHGRECFGPG